MAVNHQSTYYLHALLSDHKRRQQQQQQRHSFNGPLSGTTRVSQYQKGKTNLDLLQQETVSGSGIGWAICKSAPRPRQITIPAPHHSVITGVFLTAKEVEHKETTAKLQTFP